MTWASGARNYLSHATCAWGRRFSELTRSLRRDSGIRPSAGALGCIIPRALSPARPISRCLLLCYTCFLWYRCVFRISAYWRLLLRRGAVPQGPRLCFGSVRNCFHFTLENKVCPNDPDNQLVPAGPWKTWNIRFRIGAATWPGSLGLARLYFAFPLFPRYRPLFRLLEKLWCRSGS